MSLRRYWNCKGKVAARMQELPESQGPEATAKGSRQMSEKPICPDHPRAPVTNACRPGFDSRCWVCLVCGRRLGPAPAPVEFEDSIRVVWNYLKQRCHASDEYAENELVYWQVGLNDQPGPDDCDEMREKVRVVLRKGKA